MTQSTTPIVSFFPTFITKVQKVRKKSRISSAFFYTPLGRNGSKGSKENIAPQKYLPRDLLTQQVTYYFSVLFNLHSAIISGAN